MKKKLLLLMLLALSCVVEAEAQNFVVYSVTGKPELVMPNGSKRNLKLREMLAASDVINLPYGTTVELIDTDSRQQYTLRMPGKATVENMTADRRNSVLKLTSKYFDYIIAQVKGSGKVTTRRVSDPATVTREVYIDSMYITNPDSIRRVKPVVKQEEAPQSEDKE